MLLVGLGNPGIEYSRNRHNVGFMAVDNIASHYKFTVWQQRFKGLCCDGLVKLGQDRLDKIILFKPQTYMNNSGQAVVEALNFYKYAIDQLIVIHDDIDLEAGQIKIKTGGGHAGHNGLRSIDQYCGKEYVRIRIGIGRPVDKSFVKDYVLNNFTNAEYIWLDCLTAAISACLPLLLSEKLLSAGQAQFIAAVKQKIAAQLAI